MTLHRGSRTLSSMTSTAGRHTAPELIGHRGAPRECVENTLPAFRRALELGAAGIELDVHVSRDGVVVVHHDAVPRARRRDGAPETRPISALAWDELRTLDVGGAARMPRLEEVLALVAGRAVAYVEIKGHGIEELVVATIERGTATCAVHSFDHAAIAKVRLLAPALPRGLLIDEPADVDPLLRAHDARDLWPSHRLIDADLVAAARSAGARVVAWTVNDAARAIVLHEMGVAALCTDDLPALRRALETPGQDFAAR